MKLARYSKNSSYYNNLIMNKMFKKVFQTRIIESKREEEIFLKEYLKVAESIKADGKPLTEEEKKLLIEQFYSEKE